ncbi:MAG: DUF1329 domain-containing protein [Gammaproteobacteria bacterium]|nr:DUF1329 domain-containing protein [Gammaproteobacteria bacterium]
MSRRFLLAALCLSLPGPALAKVDAEQALRLGQALTPLGAETAGNATGTIPAWEGGLKKPVPGYEKGAHHPDPYAADKPLFTITAANMAQYAANLSPGQQALLKAYPDWRMQVYPSRRSAAFPDKIYKASKANAGRAELANNGIGVQNAFVGIPFPIPGNGLEAVWNHELRYRGDQAVRQRGQAAVHEDGGFTLVKFTDKLDSVYSRNDEDAAKDYTLFRLKQEIGAPAGLAGTIVLVHETTNMLEAPRRTWIFNPKDKRVRRVGEYAYDDASTAADGLATVDNFDGFSGTPDRYDWTLKGKQELYIPYNSYKLHAKDLAYEDILKPGHINPELGRYELHRVWVVEGQLKLGASHVYAKRVLYLDEDSWQAAVIDHYDEEGGLWRVAETHALNYYEVPVLFNTLEVLHDLKAKRYLVSGLDNQERMADFSVKLGEDEFTSSSVRRQGK